MRHHDEWEEPYIQHWLQSGIHLRSNEEVSSKTSLRIRCTKVVNMALITPTSNLHPESHVSDHSTPLFSHPVAPSKGL